MPRTNTQCLLVLIIAFLAVGGPVELHAQERPNVIVFLTDDQGWGDLGCYGHPRIKSPHIDQFAEEGMRFTQFYSASGVCSPSRSAILTGRTPYRNGVYRWIPSGSNVHLRSSEITIAELLKDEGYATCHVGKWHLNGKFNTDQQPQPDDQGYDWWFATQNNARPSHRNPKNFVRNGEALGQLDGYSAILVVEEAIRWLKNHRDPDRPFFLTVWTHEPHKPIESAPRFTKQYPEIEDKGKREHHANITQIDQAFGKLMDHLDESGETEDTMVIYTSDNGPEGSGNSGRTRGSTGGLRGRKRDMYEGGIRVPGIVRWPGHVEPGSVSHQPVVGYDIFTTICDVVDIPVPQDRTIDGTSFVPALNGQPIEREKPMYWRCRIASGPKMALREGDWKILGNRRLTSFELFNIANDPKEQNELSDKFPDRFERMKKKLIDFNADVEAEGPDWFRKGLRQQAKISRDGTDETGDFDVVKGGTIRSSSMGYSFEAPGEAMALKQLSQPISDRASFSMRYRTLTDQNIRNGFLVFGNKPDNYEAVKVGSMIGMGTHGVFQGSWNAINKSRIVNVDFDKSKTFELRVSIDLNRNEVQVQIDDEQFTRPLPENLEQVKYYGYYVKNTRTGFTPIDLSR